MLVVLTVCLASCGTSADNQTASCQTLQIQQKSANFYYIDLRDLHGFPGDNVDIISGAFALWEQQNPDKKIVAYQIDFQPNNYSIQSYLLGISIYSEPK